MKHFNMGVVVGRIASVEQKKSRGDGKPYLQIQFDCFNDTYGSIKAYGRLWGEAKIDAFMDQFKKHSGAVYRFKGFFKQYDDEEGLRLSNFSFYEWAVSSANVLRAIFILVGEITGIEAPKGEGKLHIHLVREGKGNYKEQKEDFVVYTANAQDVSGFEIGQTVKVKGLLMSTEPEDFFCETKGHVKPYAKNIEVVTENPAEPAEVF